MPTDANALIQEAYASRPELAGLRAEQGAALKFADAEKRLWLPSVTALASAGAVPGHEDGIRGRYGALGLNVNIPIFNGHLFAARRSEAGFRSQVAEENLKDMQIRIPRDVQVAWLNAKTAYERLSITKQLLDEARQALELAQSRYNLGLSSIVELSQAQLNETSAEIASATARYDYQLQRSVLDYQTGALR